MEKIKIIIVLALILNLFLIFGCDKKDASPAVEDVEQTARQFVDFLYNREFEEANNMLSATMVKALKDQNLTLEEIWDGVIIQTGKLNEIKETKVTEEMGYSCVYITCDFKNISSNIKVVLDKEGKVAGLFFIPFQNSETYITPEYVNTSLFTERECIVGEEWQLPATLTIPEGKGPFPAVILVHGSGPADRDETIGINKPFKDIAWGLATRGIVVLRYEKRTRQYAHKIVDEINDYTVNEETIDDALAAVNLLREVEEVDSGKIFIIGHSLGATLAPRIAARDEEIAGLILLAGGSRGLYIEKLLEQTEYLASLDGKIDEAETEQMDEIEKQLKKIRELDIKEGEIVLGASKAYWEDLIAYDPVKTAKNLTIPMLLLQGERDYQVTMEDFREWEKGLSGKDKVCFKSYQDLNHLFISGTGKSTPDDYTKPGNVAQVVIEDIAEWVKNQ
ncbi:MAG: DUF3887 domain-containing protein [Actinomycetota bacterium]|nr:DUF3887 domain-containing protein [Actinomycetota bacterium]